MSVWAARRFWQRAEPAEVPGGFTVLLDAKPVRTPAKAAFVLPTRALAQAICAEWAAQEGRVRPETMPLTRAANSAIDKVGPQFAAVAEAVAAYGATDTLCYRATAPEALVRRQEEAWQPLLDWAAEALGAPLRTTQGVIPVAQPAASLEALSDRVHAKTPFRLMALHDLVAITGSLVLGLAVTTGRLGAGEAWALSRIDEDWQAELWGRDEEAEAAAQDRRAGLEIAAQFFSLCR